MHFLSFYFLTKHLLISITLWGGVSLAGAKQIMIIDNIKANSQVGKPKFIYSTKIRFLKLNHI